MFSKLGQSLPARQELYAGQFETGIIKKWREQQELHLQSYYKKQGVAENRSLPSPWLSGLDVSTIAGEGKRKQRHKQQKSSAKLFIILNFFRQFLGGQNFKPHLKW